MRLSTRSLVFWGWVMSPGQAMSEEGTRFCIFCCFLCAFLNFISQVLDRWKMGWMGDVWTCLLSPKATTCTKRQIARLSPIATHSYSARTFLNSPTFGSRQERTRQRPHSSKSSGLLQPYMFEDVALVLLVRVKRLYEMWEYVRLQTWCLKQGRYDMDLGLIWYDGIEMVNGLLWSWMTWGLTVLHAGHHVETGKPCDNVITTCITKFPGF